MSSKRTIALMGVLLCLLAYIGWQWFPPYFAEPLTAAKPLPGRTEIRRMELQRKPDGGWSIAIDYFYTGEPELLALRVEQVNSREGVNPTPEKLLIGFNRLARGANSMTFDLGRPADEAVRITREITAEIRELKGSVVAARTLAQPIEWPSLRMVQVDREMAAKTSEQVLAQAVDLIDEGQDGSLRHAKLLLERLLEKDPRSDGAFVEMARVAMKLQWGPEGLAQAEGLLRSALQLRPDSVNANILLAYVYANQKRYKEAEALYVGLSKVETPNLWLGTNWGEMLEQQGRTSAAIAKYREVLAHAPKQDSYDRARQHAARRLMGLLVGSKDLNLVEALHKQLTTDYGADNCFGTGYARFLVQQRGDAVAAVSMAKRASQNSCDEEAARQVLGLAQYLAWSQAREPGRAEALRQARVARPVGPALFYELASSEHTLAAIQQLVAEGERIDQLDNSRLTALAYALRADDLVAARRLLRLGARPDALVGEEQMPLALMPVLTANVESIRLMQKAGIDYSRLRFKGMTALDHARSIHDGRLLQALDPKAGAL
jgi:tetratricopeptide (TPR) repeat protein